MNSLACGYGRVSGQPTVDVTASSAGVAIPSPPRI
jgi:hypothetical protein